MLEILRDLVELVKNMKHGTECGSEFNDECERCRDYHVCLDALQHCEKCDVILNKLDVLVVDFKKIRE